MAPLSRCLICNAPLEEIPKDRAWGLVPPYVFCTQEWFRLCPVCNRFYWRGTHWERMRVVLERWAPGGTLADDPGRRSAGSGGS